MSGHIYRFLQRMHIGQHAFILFLQSSRFLLHLSVFFLPQVELAVDEDGVAMLAVAGGCRGTGLALAFHLGWKHWIILLLTTIIVLLSVIQMDLFKDLYERRCANCAFNGWSRVLLSLTIEKHSISITIEAGLPIFTNFSKNLNPNPKFLQQQPQPKKRMLKTITEVLQQSKQLNHLRNTHKPMLHSLSIGRLIGYLIFVMYFTLLPAGLKLVWPYFFGRFSVTAVYVGSVFAINVGIFVLYNSVLYVIYRLKHPFFEQYKNTDKPWPWQQNPEQWQKLKLRSIKTILINFFIVTPIMVYISILTSLPFDFSLQNWPSPFRLIWQIAIFLLVQDILFYFSHRLLHQPGWYWIHKYHHQYRQTVSLAAHYVHPIEYVLSGTLPSSLGFQLLSFVTDVHYATVLVWLIYRMVQSYQGHCGYTWTWNTLSLFPYTVGSDYHDFHHAMNAGNYGSIFIFWDALFQTQTPFIDYLSKQNLDKSKNE